jgi:hypothetical protein
MGFLMLSLVLSASVAGGIDGAGISLMSLCCANIVLASAERIHGHFAGSGGTLKFPVRYFVPDIREGPITP